MAEVQVNRDAKASTAIDHTKQAIRGLDDYYKSLFVFRKPTPFQTFYGIPADIAWKIKNKEINPGILKPEDLHRDSVEIGANGSGKTKNGTFKALYYSTHYPDNLGLIIRYSWSEILTSIMEDFDALVDKVTDGNKKYLIADGEAHRHEGYYSYEIFTGNGRYPSRILCKPEPDKASDRQVADALKQADYGWVIFDELTQLREITYDTLRLRLRRQSRAPGVKILKFSTGLTNPPVRGHWLHTREEEQSEILDSDKTKILFIHSSMLDNLHLGEDYIRNAVAQFRNDPMGYRMYILGENGVEVDGVPVYKGSFSSNNVTADLKLNVFDDLYVGMDFGFHHSTAVFGQITRTGHINILDELRCERMDAPAFGRSLMAYLKQRFPKVPLGRVRFFGDHAGTQQSSANEMPPITQLRKKLGIRVESTPVSSVDSGLDLIRSLFKEGRELGATVVPRLRIHPRCDELVTACSGGYFYKTQGGKSKSKPYDDKFYIHMADAKRYFIINTIHPISEEQKRTRRRGHGSGFAVRRPILQPSGPVGD